VIPAAVGIKQVLEQTAAYPVRGCTNGHLTGFQVHMPVVPQIVKNTLHKPIYFLRHFPENCFCNFFFSASRSFSSSMTAAGRSRQIFSFTSTNSLQRRRKTS
jgi:hypothetical protein